MESPRLHRLRLRGLAESVAGTGVTVNSILAGPTESEGVGAFVEAMARKENTTNGAALRGGGGVVRAIL